MTKNSSCTEAGFLVNIGIEPRIAVCILDIQHRFVTCNPTSYTRRCGESYFLQSSMAVFNVINRFEVQLIRRIIHQEEGTSLAIDEFAKALHNYPSNGVYFPTV